MSSRLARLVRFARAALPARWRPRWMHGAALGLAGLLAAGLFSGCALLTGEDGPWDTHIPESEPFDAYLGTWNPDGTRIAFQHTGELSQPDPGLLDQLWIFERETGRRWMVFPGRVLAIDWSPDGQWFVFHSFSDPQYLFKVDVDGERLTRLTGENSPSPGFRYTVAGHWSPDGDQILFVVEAGEPRGSSLMNADGSDARLLIPYGVNGSWFPDGRRIAYVNWDTTQQAGRRRQVYVANADGTGIEKLTDLPDSDLISTPVVSPDGQQIAFVHRGGNRRTEIYLMNVDGRQIRQVTGIGDVNDPEWSPDGKQILFSRFLPNISKRLYLLDVETREVVPVFPAMK